MMVSRRQGLLGRTLAAPPKTELGENKAIKKNRIFMVVALFLINFGFEIPLVKLRADTI
jgi:hypothetical protein